jgi:hypothetical protein
LEAAAQSLATDKRALARLLHNFVQELDEQSEHWPEWHANGFAKFATLASEDRELKIRIHLWLPLSANQTKVSEQNIHGHRWEFGSAVIAGDGIRVWEYIHDQQQGIPYLGYNYSPAEGTLLASNPTRLGRLPARVILKDQAYSWGLDRLHTVEPVGEDLTATLCVQGVPRSQFAPVFRDPQLGDQEQTRRMSRTEAMDALLRIIEEVRVGGPGR